MEKDLRPFCTGRGRDRELRARLGRCILHALQPRGRALARSVELRAEAFEVLPAARRPVRLGGCSTAAAAPGAVDASGAGHASFTPRPSDSPWGVEFLR
jgi:hypothetical protein